MTHHDATVLLLLVLAYLQFYAAMSTIWEHWRNRGKQLEAHEADTLGKVIHGDFGGAS